VEYIHRNIYIGIYTSHGRLHAIHLLRWFLRGTNQLPSTVDDQLGVALLAPMSGNMQIASFCEDIYQELVLVFLECARRASNLQYAFRRDALRRLAHMAHGANFPLHLEDLLDRLGNGEIDTESEVPCEHQKVVPMALRSDGGFRSSEELWVLGVQDETDLFAEFDTVERELLVLRYLHHVDWRSLRRRYGRSVVDGCLAKLRRLRCGRTDHSTDGSNAPDVG
jgi:hypothetical protein